MTVFSLFDPRSSGPVVDLFLESPIEFTGVHARSGEVELEGRRVRICGIDDLIELKTRSARPIDALDIASLRSIKSKIGPLALE